MGSGRRHFEDYLTVDSDPKVGADFCLDIENFDFALFKHFYNVEKDIDITANSVDEIRACHILEHIQPANKVKVMRFFYDLLKPGGFIKIEVPCFPCPASVQDPTHISFWNKESFYYFIKGNKFGEGFAKRHSTPEVPLFEFVASNGKEHPGKEILTKYYAYNLILKKPNGK